VRLTVAIAIYIQTPSTILRLGGFFDANDEREHAEDE
jgi:hypothetical protein